MSTHNVDLLMGTKQDTSLSTDLSWTSVKRSLSVHRLLSPLKTESHLKPAAGQCRTSGMCTWRREEKKVPEQLKEGGEPALLILHPSPGSNRLKPS